MFLLFFDSAISWKVASPCGVGLSTSGCLYENYWDSDRNYMASMLEVDKIYDS